MLFRLIRNGINPLKGILSGRIAKFSSPDDGKIPNFSKNDKSLVIMRTTGKSGLILNNYSSFLEVKLNRNEKVSVITDFYVSLIRFNNLKNVLFRRILGIYPYLLDFKLHKYLINNPSVLFPLWHPYQNAGFLNSLSILEERELKLSDKIGPNRVYFDQNLSIRNGRTIVNSKMKILNIEETLEIKNGLWPRYVWKSHCGSELQMPNTFRSERIEHGTFIYAVNNIFHFIEDTIPQILISNKQIPDNTILIGGNLDSILEEIATSSSNAPVIFMRDEESIDCKNLNFFQLDNYRSALASGIRLDIDEQAKLIREISQKLRLDHIFHGKPKKKLFIVRKKGLQRQLSNYKSVHRALKREGFIFVDFEPLSLNERLEILSECEILVGESGAGLAHAYFLHPESRVLEIRHPKMIGSLEQETLIRSTSIDYLFVNGEYASFFQRILHGKDAFVVQIGSLISAIRR
jgi:hypothetical protein